MNIFLIGTAHKYQLRTPQNLEADQESFKSLVMNACAHYHTRLIAEEMNEDSLLKCGATQTICSEIAEAMSDTGHLLADPDSEERKLLGIENVDDVWPNMAHEVLMRPGRRISSEEIERESDRMTAADPRVRSSHEKREREWIRRLQSKNQFPVLFVCGTYHVQSFSQLAESMGFVVTVLHADWHPGHSSATVLTIRGPARHVHKPT